MKLTIKEAKIMGNIFQKAHALSDAMEEIRPAGGFDECVEKKNSKPPSLKQRWIDQFLGSPKSVPPDIREKRKELIRDTVLYAAAYTPAAVMGDRTMSITEIFEKLDVL